MILAGDIGGTNTRLAAFESANGQPHAVVSGVFRSREHASLDEIVGQFVATHHLSISGACFGVAGPVRNGRSTVTNLPWVIDARQLAGELGLPTVELLNDLEANAYGIAALTPDDLATLNDGVPGATGNIAVIAAGTGLGIAGLFWDGSQHHVFASEGGHADFSPRDELELDLLRYLLDRWPHVSSERVLSGPGLYNLYGFLRDTGRGEEPPWLAERLRTEDPSAVIASAALDGTSGLCQLTLERFAAVYGAAAGNVALTVLATGGVYLGGGIAPKIITALRGPTFLRAFTEKGRLAPLLSTVPIHVILNDRCVLLGAARRALLAAL